MIKVLLWLVGTTYLKQNVSAAGCKLQIARKSGCKNENI
jgi:hypothetical protein